MLYSTKRVDLCCFGTYQEGARRLTFALPLAKPRHHGTLPDIKILRSTELTEYLVSSLRKSLRSSNSSSTLVGRTSTRSVSLPTLLESRRCSFNCHCLSCCLLFPTALHPLAKPLKVTIKKSKTQGTKFKLRCARYLYTLRILDASKADKLKQSLPPGESTTSLYPF